MEVNYMATLVTQLGTTTGSQRQIRSNRLLSSGVLAGPFYVALALAQAFTRPGFDLRRHDISLLTNGSLGWIQIGNFLISGVLVIGAATVLRHALATGPTRTWGPRLVAAYGACIALAGIFVADPMGGFPPGSAQATAMSWHGGLHLLCGAVGFLALITACFVFACRFFHEGRRGWGIYSAANGALYLVTFFGSVFVGQSMPGLSVLGLWIAVLLGWSWLTAVCAKGVPA